MASNRRGDLASRSAWLGIAAAAITWTAAPTAEATPPSYPALIECDNVLLHALPTGIIREVQMRNGTVVFEWERLSQHAIYALDVATNTRWPITSFSATHWDQQPDLVNDDLMVYARYDLVAATTTLLARWRGLDMVWGSGDDLEWQVDAGRFVDGISANEGELAYVRTTGPVSAPVSEYGHCDFFFGATTTPCLQGFVAYEPAVWGTTSTPHPVGGGAFVRTLNWGSSEWIAPGVAAQPWTNDAPLDSGGPFGGLFVLSRNVDGDLVVRGDTFPAGQPLWTATADIVVHAALSPTLGSNGNFRAAFLSGLDGYVADLGGYSSPAMGALTELAFNVSIAVEGDLAAYGTAIRTIVVDSCVF